MTNHAEVDKKLSHDTAWPPVVLEKVLTLESVTQVPAVSSFVSRRLRIINSDLEWNNDWTSLTECSAPCGGGTRIEQRTCPEEGYKCPGGIALSKRSVPCNEHACGKTKT